MLEKKPSFGTRPTRLARMLSFAVFLLAVSAGRSDADFGFGFGFGLGFENPKTETNFLNQWSLQNGAAASANRPTNHTAPRFQTRDDGFMERYDLATREAMVNRIARNPAREMRTVNPGGVRLSSTSPAPRTTTPAPAQAPAAAKPKQEMLLATFFDADRRLVWPGESPMTGGLSAKRQVADQAILAVLNEYQLEGLARLSNVTNARERLLEYGRPALDYARRQSTPALAEAFHSFLLSLYANVGLAATVPKAP